MMVPRNPFEGLDGNRRKNEKGPLHVIFRKHVINGRVMLEPFTDVDRIDMKEGDEFLTGTLSKDWGTAQLVKDEK